mmetsp:Transcript_401/g.231  ORF Transcript_401/g.231 Transcript_401/m.231 type:complete len:89 (-) Transcript_401:1341-1607(-)
MIGTASITMQVNQKPIVGNLVISPTTGDTETVFLITPSGFYDPEGTTLTYEYFYTQHGVPKKIKVEPNSLFELETTLKLGKKEDDYSY